MGFNSGFKGLKLT